MHVKSISTLPELNGPSNHTDDYETDALVVRRGGSFLLDIQWETSNEGQEDEDGGGDDYVFHLELKTGKRPKKRDGSLIEIHEDETSKDSPSYQIIDDQTDDNSVRVEATLPADSLVSCYTLHVVSSLKKRGKRKRFEYEHPKPVYVLFNAWCPEDEVYMESEDLKEEYVLSDSGWVFWSGQRPKPWYFGQFTETALQCTFKLLESTAPSRRDNAREVSRHISARCNSNDNNGLLEGNWSGDYDGGVKPWVWSGSVAIFKKYLATEEPVKYGQCWVFSGLTTSLMRCLGVPTRSVTNYDSAHDTDNNCTFDKYLDEDFNYLDDESDDSCWNFHVWNDVWMARPDLPVGMGGWQAIDGTPQEESKGIYRCGPSSLQSIREGEVNHKYDTKFVFAEVNADTVYWKRNPDDEEKPWLPIRVKGNSVGTAILTKEPNYLLTENITNQYKYADGSLLERGAVRKALKKVRNPVVDEKANDVKFSSKVPWNLNTDKPINVAIKVINDTSKLYNVHCGVTAFVVRYNGVKMKALKKRFESKQLEANSTESLDFEYDASDYVEYLDENISLRFVMVSRVLETNQVYISTKICNVHKSELVIEAIGNDSGRVKFGDTLQVKIKVPSIFGVATFTNCSLEVDCPLVDNIDEQITDVPADGLGVIEKTFTIKKSKKSKENELVATFSSKEISGVHGTLKLEVVPQ